MFFPDLQKKSFPKMNIPYLDPKLKIFSMLIMILSSYVCAIVWNIQCPTYVAVQESYRSSFWLIRKSLLRKKLQGSIRACTNGSDYRTKALYCICPNYIENSSGNGRSFLRCTSLVLSIYLSRDKTPVNSFISHTVKKSAYLTIVLTLKNK